jgi:putative transposase
MSARANPYDNAWTESFIGILKKEMGVLLHKLDPQQIQLNCFHYIEGYYNTQRRHSAPGYISPSKFEAIHSLN